MRSEPDKSSAAAVAQAREKLERLHQSPNYRSFFSDEAIAAFSKVEDSAFAGRGRSRHDHGTAPLNKD
jgi:hypothetical protein